MFNQNKKYGYIIQNNKLSPKNKNNLIEPKINIADKIFQNLNLLNQTKKLINNENQSNDNAEYFDSDIDDPKYKPSYLLNKDLREKKEYDFNNIVIDKTNKEYNNINEPNIMSMSCMSNSKYHNFENDKNININIPKDNYFQNKNILDLQNENELLKQELLKKSETIRAKDELISEFQNIYKDLKSRFEQYESKNTQLKQQIKYLENQLMNNQYISKNNLNEISNKEMSEKTIALFKQQISDLESDYNNKTKKLLEKFKEKENKIKQDNTEEISRLNKNIENMRQENSKLKTEISNNKVEIDSLKAKLESKDYEKNTYLDQKEKEILKLKERISEQDREIEYKEKELKQRINKLEDQISLMKQENNNLINKVSEGKEKFNEYEIEITDQKNIINRLNNELNQINLSVQNKDALIEQLKNQIEELNDLLIQSEEDLKLFEENKQQEFKEYSEQIENIIDENNLLKAQNKELTENLSLANENMKQLNELISDKYADVEAELLRQTSHKENLEKKYKDIFKHMKNKQNLLNQENNKLKEIINNQEGQLENLEDNNDNINNLNNINFQSPLMNDMNPRNVNNNLININENAEPIFRNNNLNNNTNLNYNNSSSYIDTKEERQKRTLNNFKMLLDKMDEKIEVQ